MTCLSDTIYQYVINKSFNQNFVGLFVTVTQGVKKFNPINEHANATFLIKIASVRMPYPAYPQKPVTLPLYVYTSSVAPYICMHKS